MIRRVPDHFALFQGLIIPFRSLRSSIDLFERMRPQVCSQSSSGLSLGAIHTNTRLLQAKLARTQFQSQKVPDPLTTNPAFLRLNVTDMFHSDHFRPARNTLIGPKPGHPGFHYAHAYGFEVLDDHLLAFLLTHLREAQFQISRKQFLPDVSSNVAPVDLTHSPT